MYWCETNIKFSYFFFLANRFILSSMPQWCHIKPLIRIFWQSHALNKRSQIDTKWFIRSSHKRRIKRKNFVLKHPMTQLKSSERPNGKISHFRSSIAPHSTKQNYIFQWNDSSFFLWFMWFFPSRHFCFIYEKKK